jgi:hypothetical protein
MLHVILTWETRPFFPPKGVARGFKSALKYVYYYVGQIHLVYIHTVHVYIDVYRSETRCCEVTTDHSINTEPHLVKQTAELGDKRCNTR